VARRIVIVGAGPAGIRAAETLAMAGLRPVVIDREPASGGQIYRRPPPGFSRPASALYGEDAGKATALHDVFDGLVGRMDYRPRSEVFGITGDIVHVHDGRTLTDLPFDALILATGATDRIAPLPGWTLPGVHSLGGAQIALKSQGCAIGHRVVLIGSGPLLTLVAVQYADAGADVAAVLDTASRADLARGAVHMMAARPGLLARGLRLRARLRRHGVPYCNGVRDLRIEGAQEVERVVWRTAGGAVRSAECDGVGMGWHLRSETQLAQLAGCALVWDAAWQQSVPMADPMGRSSRRGVYLAGDGVRILGADGAEFAGRLAALACLQDLGLPAVADSAPLLGRMRAMRRFARGLAIAFPYPDRMCRALPDDTLLCRCEAITAGQFRAVLARSGAAEPNRAKSLSRVGMGRCQGRYCAAAAARILAAERGLDLAEMPGLRPQAPVRPMPMSLRAAPSPPARTEGDAT